MGKYKKIIAGSMLALFVLGSCATMQKVEVSEKVVDATCGQCNWGMTSDDCMLAVKIDGKEYIVEGSDVEGHGDAHAADGMCRVERKAKVSGYTRGKIFYATSFELIPAK